MNIDYKNYFIGKKITLMGLGILGRGIGDARIMAEYCQELIITDLKSKEELKESVSKLSGFSNIKFVLGEHRMSDFINRDLIIKSAGVPIDSPFILFAKENNIQVRMSADLLVELSGAYSIGVTGTRGKSTTTHMIESILKCATKNVFVGGNVRGVSNLELLKKITKYDMLVLELDSWQCQGFGESKISPNLAIFTTFFPDHLNYYKGNLDNYLADKANIFLNQKARDFLILGDQCGDVVLEKYKNNILSKIKVISEKDLPNEWMLIVKGNHNRYNASLALACARILGIGDDVSKKALESFSAVVGRLQSLGEKDGIFIYNDNNATTPEAVIAGLNALDIGKKNIILIMGGADKMLETKKMVEEINKKTKKVVLLSGTGTDRLISEYEDVFSKPYTNLKDAVLSAFAEAQKGDIILFCPGFASFGMFKNEYDRNDQFVDIINNHGKE